MLWIHRFFQNYLQLTWNEDVIYSMFEYMPIFFYECFVRLLLIPFFFPLWIWTTVFKFVEQPENNEKQLDQKSKVKFKIMSLKVKAGIDYVPELVKNLLYIIN